MYKEQLIAILAAQTGTPRASVRRIIDAFTNKIAEMMVVGEPVVISGFGIFTTKSRSPRIGRNPHTKEPVSIPARVMPNFKPAPGLIERVSVAAYQPDSKSLYDSPVK